MRTSAIHGLWFTLLLLCSGCQYGPTLSSVGPATSAAGTNAEVRLRVAGNPTITGEILAVSPEGLLIATESGLTLLYFAVIDRARFADAPGVGRWTGPGTASQRTKLALFSRYPFGLDAQRLGLLLEARDQQELIRTRR